MNSVWWTWVLLPMLIFLARLADVSIGTLRIVFVARGSRLWAPILGFFEIMIWLLAIGQIFKHLDNIFCYIAYAGGFAMGNLIGLSIENKLALGKIAMRIITRRDSLQLRRWLRNNRYGLTTVDAKGTKGPVKIIFLIIKRKDLPVVTEKLMQFNPKAFYTIEDIKVAREGVFPLQTSKIKRLRRRTSANRKGK